MNTKYTWLQTVHTPEDLKALPSSALAPLCEEIRAFLLEHVPKTGGHLASNLGVVELTVAMHRVFDCPKDHFIFDVGHQAYVHKILTKRKHLFADLRKCGGLSGFTTRKEGPYDAFGAGHSSTSLSAALGFAEADHLLGRDAVSVCVVGDGAYTGGMIHEALNNCKKDLPLVIILNENGMSISPNRGTFANYLSRVRVSTRYRRFRKRVEDSVGKSSGFGRFLRAVHHRIRRVIYPMNHFEELGLYYIGPVDGHDMDAVLAALTRARELGQTTVVHVRTQKGRGYTPAEDEPQTFHSLRAGRGPETTFHGEFCRLLTEAAADDASIVAVTAAMGLGTGLAAFGEQYPERYFDVGIAEEHALTFSAGLAAAGLKPFVAIYSTFLQRAYDNILHDVALQELPVRMVIDRAGLAASDGATHHGIFDVAFLSQLPGVRILTPATYDGLRLATRELLEATGPVALRYADTAESAAVAAAFAPSSGRTLGVRADFEGTPPPRLIVTYGQQALRALEASRMLRERGIHVGVLLLEVLAPYDETAAALAPYVGGATHILFAEEGIYEGGASVLLCERLRAHRALRPDACVRIAAVRDFASPHTRCDLYDHVGLSAKALCEYFLKPPSPLA